MKRGDRRRVYMRYGEDQPDEAIGEIGIERANLTQQHMTATPWEGSGMALGGIGCKEAARGAGDEM